MDFNERRRIDQSGISYAILTAIIILLILILWSHLAVAANPSFDCRKATMEDEFAICSDDDLSDRDNEVAAAFRQLKRVVGNQKSREIARYWLDIRHSCGSDTECIGNVQRNAINEFMSYVNRHDDNGSALQHQDEYHRHDDQGVGIGFPISFISDFNFLNRDTSIQAMFLAGVGCIAYLSFLYIRWHSSEKCPSCGTINWHRSAEHSDLLDRKMRLGTRDNPTYRDGLFRHRLAYYIYYDETIRFHMKCKKCNRRWTVVRNKQN